MGASHIEPGGNAQNLGTPLGKMLRIDPLLPTLTPSSADPISGNGQYRIPTSNPFLGPGLVPELYGKYVFGDLALHTAPARADGRLFYADLATGEILEFLLPQFAGGACLTG